MIGDVGDLLRAGGRLELGVLGGEECVVGRSRSLDAWAAADWYGHGLLESSSPTRGARNSECFRLVVTPLFVPCRFEEQGAK